MKLVLDLFRPRAPEADALGAFVAALILTGLGLLCVYSFGGEQVVRQAAWAALAIASSIAVSRVPLDRLRRAATPALAVSAALLVTALLVAPSIAGTKRWLVIGSIGLFQPSEIAKVAFVLFLAARLADARAGEALLPRVWPVVPVCVLVLLAPDLGTTVFLAALVTALLLIAGARVGRLLGAGVAAIVLLFIVASQVPYMRKRLDFFEGELNYQQVQALIAFGSGGLMGNGLGAGRQKLDYLPAGHTDFVLPNLGEELGFLGVALVGLLFGLLCVYGVRVAIAAARRGEMFGFYVASGATFLVVFQAVVNMAVATAAAPTKGISLPFLSQGGSNLLAALLAVGLVVNVGRSLEARR